MGTKSFSFPEICNMVTGMLVTDSMEDVKTMLRWLIPSVPLFDSMTPMETHARQQQAAKALLHHYPEFQPITEIVSEVVFLQERYADINLTCDMWLMLAYHKLKTETPFHELSYSIPKGLAEPGFQLKEES